MTIQYGDPKFDLRTLERSLREKTVEPKEMDKYIKSLPDESANAEEMKVFEEETESDNNSNGPLREPTFSV